MKILLSIIFIFFSYPVISETIITCYAKGIWHDSDYIDMQGDIELEQTISYREKKLISIENSFFKYPIKFDRKFQNLVEQKYIFDTEVSEKDGNYVTKEFDINSDKIIFNLSFKDKDNGKLIARLDSQINRKSGKFKVSSMAKITYQSTHVLERTMAARLNLHGNCKKLKNKF